MFDYIYVNHSIRMPKERIPDNVRYLLANTRRYSSSNLIAWDLTCGTQTPEVVVEIRKMFTSGAFQQEYKAPRFYDFKETSWGLLLVYTVRPRVIYLPDKRT
jgi:hypothetical protein